MQRRVWFDRRFVLGMPREALPDLVERLRGTPLRLGERTAGLSDTALTTRVEGGWSIQEHAGHLADLEDLWLGRLEDFARGQATLRPADLQNRPTWEADHNVGSLEGILERFRVLRERMVARIAAMTEGELGATAAHPRLGQPMTVADLSFFVAEHDDHHLAAVTGLRLALQRASSGDAAG